MDTTNLKRFAELEQRKKERQDELDHIKKELKQLEAEIMDTFLEEGIRKFTVTVKTESGDEIDRTLYLHRQLWAGYQKDENGNGNGKAALTAALEQEGLSDLVKKDFNTQSLSAYIREFDEGGEDPEDIKAKLPEGLQDKIKISEVNQIKTRNN